MFAIGRYSRSVVECVKYTALFIVLVVSPSNSRGTHDEVGFRQRFVCHDWVSRVTVPSGRIDRLTFVGVRCFHICNKKVTEDRQFFPTSCLSAKKEFQFLFVGGGVEEWLGELVLSYVLRITDVVAIPFVRISILFSSVVGYHIIIPGS